MQPAYSPRGHDIRLHNALPTEDSGAGPRREVLCWCGPGGAGRDRRLRRVVTIGGPGVLWAMQRSSGHLVGPSQRWALARTSAPPHPPSYPDAKHHRNARHHDQLGGEAETLPSTGPGRPVTPNGPHQPTPLDAHPVIREES